MKKPEGQVLKAPTLSEEDRASETYPSSEKTYELRNRQKSAKDSDEQSFMELYEKSLKDVREGELVKGQIVRIGKENVLIDIGYKSEGQVPIHEFLDSEGNVTAKVGDPVDVILEGRENEDGLIMLSKKKAVEIKTWDRIRETYEKDGSIQGKIVSRVKGGLSVDIGLRAFLPGSQIDVKPIKDFDAFIGTMHDFKILKYNKSRENIVISRRAILEAELAGLKEKTLNSLEEGALVDGYVKNITEYGLFVDLGGIDGLLHISDMSWSRIGHPSDMFAVNDKIAVKVLYFDRERERISLGLKQLKSDPWSDAEDKYPLGQRIRGRVLSLTNYGAFLEVEEGVEGLIHVSEMSWTRKIRHPSQVVKVGDEVEAVILRMDPARRRISLSLKQAQPNPWDMIDDKYPVGTIIEGSIKNITDFGLFIGIDEGIDGLVHISDLSWTKRIRHPSELYRKGQQVQAVVLNIDEERERFSLGIKQLTPDPWQEAARKYKPGARITGTVTNVTDFGIFVALEEGIEGLVHVSELSTDRTGNPLAKYEISDVIQAKVINVAPGEKRIGLSVKRLQETEERETYRSYLTRQGKATSNLGQILREGMTNLQLDAPTVGPKGDDPTQDH
jgi:small subunit ribosomal protein S1